MKNGEAITAERAREAFAAYAQPIAHLLLDESVTDVMLNAPSKPGEPGEVWVDRVGEGLRPAGVTMTAAEAERFIRDVGRHAAGQRQLDSNRPVLSCRAAQGQFRFEALIPPASSAPTFTIRKYLKREARIQDYVADGSLTSNVAMKLAVAAEIGETILVAGETGSGKTTLANALLHAAATNLERRILIIEDTPELDCPPGPSTKIEVQPDSGFGYREAVVSALRQRPNAIVLGELRQPDDAVEALRAWTTGHQGISTLHAASVDGTLWMLYNLCRQSERGRHTTERAIVDAVQVVVHMRRVRGRRVIDASRVVGWQGAEFKTEPLGSSGVER